MKALSQGRLSTALLSAKNGNIQPVVDTAIHTNPLLGTFSNKYSIRRTFVLIHFDTTQTSIEWQNNSDLIMWDNTCVMHRATGGSFEGKYKRDMRRATVHDGSSYAWGLNEQSNDRMGYVTLPQLISNPKANHRYTS
jgi:hypothetical protein